MPSQYVNGAVEVGTTPTLICQAPASPGDTLVGNTLIVQNAGASSVYLGGPNVASSGTSLGLALAAGATVALPTVYTDIDLYGVTASGTMPVVFFYALAGLE